LVKSLKRIITQRDLSIDPRGHISLASLDNSEYKELMYKLSKFMKRIESLFGNELYSGEFLDERPGESFELLKRI